MTPGQRERAESELATAAEALREASALLDLGLSRGAVSRLYYAVFHAARAALVSCGLHAKTHSGQLTRFVATSGRRRRSGASWNFASMPTTDRTSSV